MAWLQRMRRAEILRHPFPPEWREILARNVPAVAKLDAGERATLEDKVRIFLAEKNLEGCGGLELTDEIRVTIAAQACLLLLHLEGDAVFPTVESVLVYPSAYKAPQARRAGGIVLDDQARLGESHTRGAVVLAWDAVKRTARGGPHNLVLHEFAHALDQEDGLADGTPELPEAAMYRAWARVLGAEYEQLVAEMHAGHETSLDPYGAENAAEFFAVDRGVLRPTRGAAARASRALRATPRVLPPGPGVTRLTMNALVVPTRRGMTASIDARWLVTLSLPLAHVTSRHLSSE